MDKKKYVKPQTSVIEVETDRIMVVTMSVGDTTGVALSKRRGLFSDDEEDEAADAFDAQQ